MEHNDFVWLQQWYRAHCDGDWEHNENIVIGTVDNPGWQVTINLERTVCENKKFKTKKIEQEKAIRQEEKKQNREISLEHVANEDER